MSYVFVAFVEIRPQRRCKILDPRKVNGAFVRCYIPAIDEAAARGLLAAYCTVHRLSLVETEWIVREDQLEWEKPDDPIGRHLIEQALATDTIAIGEFHTWGHDAPDAN